MERETREWLLLLGATIIAFALLELRRVATVSLEGPAVVTLRPLAALVVVGGLLFGIVAIGGVGAGYIGHLAYRSSLELVSALEVVGLLLLGIGFATLVPVRAPDETPGSPARASVRRAIVVGTAVVVSTTAALGWAYELLGVVSFFPFTVTRTLELLVSLAVLGAPTVAIAWWFFDRIIGTDATSPVPTRRVAVEQTDLTGFVALSVIWFLAGNALSVGYHVAGLVPEVAFYRRGVGFLRPFVDRGLVGHRGRVLQAVLGAVFVVLLLAYLYRSR